MNETRLVNARIATMTDGYGLVDGGVLIRDGQIAEVGAAVRGPGEDMGGRLITPGLIDCHTHIVFGGDRAREFEMRLEGASYEEIARAGGGIVATVAATRAASEDELVAQALPRLDALIAEGVTTVEIKSGYGLDVETELRMLRAARRLGALRRVDVITTCLAAHAIPPEYAGRADAYIDEVAVPILDRLEGLADHADAFCEGIAFSPEQVARVFDAAAARGLPIKLHAEQLSNLGGAALLSGYPGALSADHVEYLDHDGIAAMAAAGVVAVLLPGAFYTLRETQAPPVAALRAAGVPIAIASDGNPGSSPMFSVLLALNMASTLFRLTPAEGLAGVTRVAAQALGHTDRGRLVPGCRADLAVWDVAHPAELAYRVGFNPLWRRYHLGVCG